MLANFIRVPTVKPRILDAAKKARAAKLGQPTDPEVRSLAAGMLSAGRKFARKNGIKGKLTQKYNMASHDTVHLLLKKKGLPSSTSRLDEALIDNVHEGMKGTRRSTKTVDRIAPNKKQARNVSAKMYREGRQLKSDPRYDKWQQADNYLTSKARKLGNYFLGDSDTANFVRVPNVKVQRLSKARRLAAKAKGQPTNPTVRALAADMLKTSRKFQKKYGLAKSNLADRRTSTYLNASHDLEHTKLLKKGYLTTPRNLGEEQIEHFEVGTGKRYSAGSKMSNSAIRERIQDRQKKGLKTLTEEETARRASKVNSKLIKEGQEFASDKKYKYYQKADRYLTGKARERL